MATLLDSYYANRSQVLGTPAITPSVTAKRQGTMLESYQKNKAQVFSQPKPQPTRPVTISQPERPSIFQPVKSLFNQVSGIVSNKLVSALNVFRETPSAEIVPGGIKAGLKRVVEGIKKEPEELFPLTSKTVVGQESRKYISDTVKTAVNTIKGAGKLTVPYMVYRASTGNPVTPKEYGKTLLESGLGVLNVAWRLTPAAPVVGAGFSSWKGVRQYLQGKIDTKELMVTPIAGVNNQPGLGESLTDNLRWAQAINIAFMATMFISPFAGRKLNSLNLKAEELTQISKTLGIKPNATLKEAGEAFRAKTKKLPDTFTLNPSAKNLEIRQELTNAYNVFKQAGVIEKQYAGAYDFIQGQLRGAGVPVEAPARKPAIEKPKALTTGREEAKPSPEAIVKTKEIPTAIEKPRAPFGEEAVAGKKLEAAKKEGGVRVGQDISDLDAQVRTIEKPTKENPSWTVEVGLQESLGEQGGDILTLQYDIEPTLREIQTDILDEYRQKKIDINKEVAMGIVAKSGRDEMIEGAIDKVLSVKEVTPSAKPPTEVTRGIPKDLEPLAQEARKIKSAEEFLSKEYGITKIENAHNAAWISPSGKLTGDLADHQESAVSTLRKLGFSPSNEYGAVQQLQKETETIRFHIGEKEIAIDVASKISPEQLKTIQKIVKEYPDLDFVFDIKNLQTGAIVKSGNNISDFIQGMKENNLLTSLYTQATGKGEKPSKITGVERELAGKAPLPDSEALLSVSKVKPATSAEELGNRIDQLNKVAQANAILRRTKSLQGVAGRFERGRKVAKEGQIALKDAVINSEADYISVLSHELGHAVEFHVTGEVNKNTMDVFGKNLDESTKTKIMQELKAVTKDLVGEKSVLSKPQYYNKPTELLARFFEKMFVSPSNLSEIAPTAVEQIELQSIEHPMIREMLEAAQGGIDKGTPKFKFLPDLRQTYQKHLGNRVGNIAYDEEVVHRAMQERAKAVIEKFVDKKFRKVKDDPVALFRAAESIKVTTGGVPEFGTRDFVVAKDLVEEKKLETAGWEKVDVQTKDGEARPVYARSRYTPEEAKKIFEQLSPEGKQLVKDFTAERQEAKDFFNREIIKDTAGIESSLEGWVHHFFEDAIPSGAVGKAMKFKEREAGARKKRTGKEGFVEDFRKATTKALVELESEKAYNDFIGRFFAIVTKPVLEGKNPDPGWVEVIGNIKKGVGTRGEKKIVIVQDGKTFTPKQARYQMPKEIYERYKLWKGLADEASTAVKVVNDINRYWRVNILAHLGTAGTNLISGGIQLSSKVLTDFYTETLTGNIKYNKTRKNISSMIRVLMPKGWVEASDWIYGADQSNWYGQFTKGEGIVGKSINNYANVALKAFGAYERYFKKVISLSEGARTLGGLSKVTKEGLKLPTKQEKEMIAQINKEIDIYAYDYDNVPVWLEAHQKSAAGQSIKPFAKYPYKYAKHIANMVGSAFDGSLPWQVRVSKLLALTTIVGLYAYYQKKREQKQQTPEGTTTTPAGLSPRGRLFIKVDEEGKEIFARTAKYPFLNLTDVGRKLINKEYEASVDAITDMIGSIGPVAKLGLLAMGYKGKYELYDEPPVVIGNTLSSYLPMVRVLGDVSRMLDPYQRKQISAYQTFTKFIPTTDEALQEKLHGEKRTVRVPIEGKIEGLPNEGARRTTTDRVLKNYWKDILLSSLTGVYLTRIDPEEAKAVLIREEKREAERKEKESE